MMPYGNELKYLPSPFRYVEYLHESLSDVDIDGVVKESLQTALLGHYFLFGFKTTPIERNLPQDGLLHPVSLDTVLSHSGSAFMPSQMGISCLGPSTQRDSGLVANQMLKHDGQRLDKYSLRPGTSCTILDILRYHVTGRKPVQDEYIMNSQNMSMNDHMEQSSILHKSHHISHASLSSSVLHGLSFGQPQALLSFECSRLSDSSVSEHTSFHKMYHYSNKEQERNTSKYHHRQSMELSSIEMPRAEDADLSSHEHFSPPASPENLSLPCIDINDSHLHSKLVSNESLLSSSRVVKLVETGCFIGSNENAKADVTKREPHLKYVNIQPEEDIANISMNGMDLDQSWNPTQLDNSHHDGIDILNGSGKSAEVLHPHDNSIHQLSHAAAGLNQISPHLTNDPQLTDSNETIDPNELDPDETIDPNPLGSDGSVDPSSQDPDQTVDPNSQDLDETVDPNLHDHTEHENDVDLDETVDPNTDGSADELSDSFLMMALGEKPRNPNMSSVAMYEEECPHGSRVVDMDNHVNGNVSSKSVHQALTSNLVSIERKQSGELSDEEPESDSFFLLVYGHVVEGGDHISMSQSQVDAPYSEGLDSFLANQTEKGKLICDRNSNRPYQSNHVDQNKVITESMEDMPQSAKDESVLSTGCSENSGEHESSQFSEMPYSEDLDAFLDEFDESMEATPSGQQVCAPDNGASNISKQSTCTPKMTTDFTDEVVCDSQNLFSQPLTANTVTSMASEATCENHTAIVEKQICAASQSTSGPVITGDICVDNRPHNSSDEIQAPFSEEMFSEELKMSLSIPVEHESGTLPLNDGCAVTSRDRKSLKKQMSVTSSSTPSSTEGSEGMQTYIFIDTNSDNKVSKYGVVDSVAADHKRIVQNSPIALHSELPCDYSSKLQIGKLFNPNSRIQHTDNQPHNISNEVQDPFSEEMFSEELEMSSNIPVEHERNELPLNGGSHVDKIPFISTASGVLSMQSELPSHKKGSVHGTDISHVEQSGVSDDGSQELFDEEAEVAYSQDMFDTEYEDNSHQTNILSDRSNDSENVFSEDLFSEPPKYFSPHRARSDVQTDTKRRIVRFAPEGTLQATQTICDIDDQMRSTPASPLRNIQKLSCLKQTPQTGLTPTPHVNLPFSPVFRHENMEESFGSDDLFSPSPQLPYRSYKEPHGAKTSGMMQSTPQQPGKDIIDNVAMVSGMDVDHNSDIDSQEDLFGDSACIDSYECDNSDKNNVVDMKKRDCDKVCKQELSDSGELFSDTSWEMEVCKKLFWSLLFYLDDIIGM